MSYMIFSYVKRKSIELQMQIPFFKNVKFLENRNQHVHTDLRNKIVFNCSDMKRCHLGLLYMT